MFIDEAKICLVSGPGGDGLISFERSKYRPKGGPSGGDGGDGGSVYLRASTRLNTLLPFKDRVHFKAEPGGAGGPHKQHGRKGRDLIVAVPVGTVVKDLHTQEVLADLDRAQETLLITRGGRGGRGNVHFKNSTRQAPRIHELGEPGEEQWLQLELKLLADVGLIGFPNVGKSSVLSRISAQRPKIASYPFTTLEPLLGIVAVDELISFVAVDIPGLIAGAHEGKGLGHRFLKHVERTRLLVHLIDLSSWEGRDPWEDYQTINRELAAFSPALALKPQLLVGNKVDLITETALEQQRVRFAEHGLDLLAISAATGRGLRELIERSYQKLQELKPSEGEAEEPHERVRRLYRPQGGTGFEVARDEEEGAFMVRGRAIERLERLCLEEPDAVAYILGELERRGILAALKRQGLRVGDQVRIGPHAFEYIEEGAL
jgi:GTP-binding protein